jgi:hypothetical protein
MSGFPSHIALLICRWISLRVNPYWTPFVFNQDKEEQSDNLTHSCWLEGPMKKITLSRTRPTICFNILNELKLTLVEYWKVFLRRTTFYIDSLKHINNTILLFFILSSATSVVTVNLNFSDLSYLFKLRKCSNSMSSNFQVYFYVTM